VKDKYAKWKELMKNPRYKALAKLGFWIIFFGVLILISVIASMFTRNRPPIIRIEPQTPIEVFANMQNFEYKYTITYRLPNEEEVTIVIEGIYFDNNYYFNIGNQEYYLSDAIYLVDRSERSLTEVETKELLLVRDVLSIKNVHYLITSGALEEEISYKDGHTTTNYIYAKEEIKIPIEVEKEENMIRSIRLNLVENKYREETPYEIFNVVMIFNNINNISSFVRNFSEFTINRLGDTDDDN